MDKDDVLNLVRRFDDSVRSIIDPRMIVLYGSYAKGSQTPTSDIDVAVIVDSIDGDLLEAEAQLYRLRREIDDRIHPVLLENGKDRSGFLENILRTGEIVYKR